MGSCLHVPGNACPTRCIEPKVLSHMCAAAGTLHQPTQSSRPQERAKSSVLDYLTVWQLDPALRLPMPSRPAGGRGSAAAASIKHYKPKGQATGLEAVAHEATVRPHPTMLHGVMLLHAPALQLAPTLPTSSYSRLMRCSCCSSLSSSSSLQSPRSALQSATDRDSLARARAHSLPAYTDSCLPAKQP